MLRGMAAGLARFLAVDAGFSNVTADSVSIIGVSVNSTNTTAGARRRELSTATYADFDFTFAVLAAALPLLSAGPSAALQAALASPGFATALTAALSSERAVLQELGAFIIRSVVLLGLRSPLVPPKYCSPFSEPGCPLGAGGVLLLAVFLTLGAVLLSVWLFRKYYFTPAEKASAGAAPVLALRGPEAPAAASAALLAPAFAPAFAPAPEPAPAPATPDELLHVSVSPSQAGGAEFALRVEFIAHFGGRGKHSLYSLLRRASEFEAADAALRARFGDAALPAVLPPLRGATLSDAEAKKRASALGVWAEGLATFINSGARGGSVEGVAEVSAFLGWERRAALARDEHARVYGDI